MSAAHRTKFVHEGQYVAEVEVQMLQAADDWGPYLTLEEATQLDEVRQALRAGDLKRASKLARIYRLTPVTVS